MKKKEKVPINLHFANFVLLPRPGALGKRWLLCKNFDVPDDVQVFRVVLSDLCTGACAVSPQIHRFKNTPEKP